MQVVILYNYIFCSHSLGRTLNNLHNSLSKSFKTCGKGIFGASFISMVGIKVIAG